jgi:UDP-N-acetylmuramyl pentapeptide synthase
MMPSLHLDAIAALGRHRRRRRRAVRALAIDSRRVQPGDLFVALRGARTSTAIVSSAMRRQRVPSPPWSRTRSVRPCRPCASTMRWRR